LDRGPIVAGKQQRRFRAITVRAALAAAGFSPAVWLEEEWKDSVVGLEVSNNEE
jgi:hypothetical protein